NVIAIPFAIREEQPENGQHSLILDREDSARDEPRGNLGAEAQTYLQRIQYGSVGVGVEAARQIWLHALAVMYSPLYRAQNIERIKQDWPRIPLPKSKPLLLASAELGGRLSYLLDTESQREGVSKGNIREGPKLIGSAKRAGGGSLKDSDLELTAGW